MSVTEWVEYQACSRDVRHLRLGEESCRLCRRPVRPDRALVSAGKFHWLVWQQSLPWVDRHRPAQVLELGADDFVAWAAADPAAHRRYLDFLDGSAVFDPAFVARPKRGYVLAPGQAPVTVILQPDGALDRPDHPAPARWGCDPAGVLVLHLDRAQYRLVGQRSGLHTGRRVVHGVRTGEPVFLGLWSDQAARTAVRLTGRSATALHGRPGAGYAEHDLFVGTGERVSVLGPEGLAGVDAPTGGRRVTYSRGPERVELEGGPAYRGRGRPRRLAAGFPTRPGVSAPGCLSGG